MSDPDTRVITLRWGFSQGYGGFTWIGFAHHLMQFHFNRMHSFPPLWFSNICLDEDRLYSSVYVIGSLAGFELGSNLGIGQTRAEF